MADTPNPPDRDDPITERAVSMGTRPVSPNVGAGRAVNAAFSRNRTMPAGGGGGLPGDARDGRKSDQQQEDLQGAGYPTEDRDDVDPKPGQGDQDGYRTEDDEVEMAERTTTATAGTRRPRASRPGTGCSRS